MVPRWMGYGTWILGVAVGAMADGRSACASTIDQYRLVSQFTLPTDSGPLDVLNDGRIITMVGGEVFVETVVGSRLFSSRGTPPASNVGAFAAFVRVAPDGTRVAIGDNAGRVGIFDLATLTGTWFTADHFDAEWFDGRLLAVAGNQANHVTLLDTSSPDPDLPSNPIIISDTGTPGGITFDAAGNLLVGNGFGNKTIGTGEIRVFPFKQWTNAADAGPALDFLTDGVLVIDILSASSLGFDAAANLHVGGGDFFGGSDLDFAALVRGSSLREAMATSIPVDPMDATAVRMLDPDATNDFNFYTIQANPVTEELYLTDFGVDTVFVYRGIGGIPALSGWGTLTVAVLLATLGTLRLHAATRRA